VGGPELYQLTFAVNDYDHVRDLASGAVRVEGVELTCVHHPVEELFFRFGGRIGVPEWTQTATVYARGVLEHQFGVPLRGVQWVQAGTNERGRGEGVSVELPEGVSVTPRPDSSLNELLLAGELDAVIAAHPPAGFGAGIVRLFTDYRAVEEEFHRDTGVFPIMHVVALRADVHAQRPWLAMNLLTALEEAKRRSLGRALDKNAPRFPVPFGPAHAERMAERFGEDFWPYGIEPNRVTLDWFLERAHEQGVCSRRLEPEELFPVEVRQRFKV